MKNVGERGDNEVISKRFCYNSIVIWIVNYPVILRGIPPSVHGNMLRSCNFMVSLFTIRLRVAFPDGLTSGKSYFPSNCTSKLCGMRRNFRLFSLVHTFVASGSRSHSLSRIGHKSVVFSHF